MVEIGDNSMEFDQIEPPETAQRMAEIERQIHGPAEVLAIVRTYAGIPETVKLYAVSYGIMSVGWAWRPLLIRMNAVRLWNVNLPGSDEIIARRTRGLMTSTKPTFTGALMAVSVVQLVDGSYKLWRARYDVVEEREEQEERPERGCILPPVVVLVVIGLLILALMRGC